MLDCWRGSSARKGHSVIWDAIPLCLLWMLWKERNRRAFKDSKRSSVELKLIFLWATCDWMDALSGHSLSSVLDFCFPH